MSTMTSSSCLSDSESNSRNEDRGSHGFQKPPPISVLKKLLDQRYTSSKADLSKSSGAVARPETRHHLVDLHGLTLFLRRATRCLQCFKPGSLSLMGNTSRDQQPPCVTKISIKCHNCCFLLSQELKKPKSPLGVDTTKKIPDSETKVHSTSQDTTSKHSARPLEEVWIQEEQSEKELGEKRRREYNDDPLTVFADRKKRLKQQTQRQETKAGETEFLSPFNVRLQPEIREHTNVYWIPRDRSKTSPQIAANEENLRSKGSEAKLALIASEVKPRHNTDLCSQTDLSLNLLPCMKENITKGDQPELNLIPGSWMGKESSTTSFDIKKNDDRYTSSNFASTQLTAGSLGFPDDLVPLQERGSLKNSFLTNIIEDFENIANTASAKQSNNVSSTVINCKEEKNSCEDDVKSNFLPKEKRDYETKNSITIENLNVSNINFPNNLPTNCGYTPANKNNTTLHDSRIIMKLLNLTETLKSELIFRAHEIERQSCENVQPRQDLSMAKGKDIMERVKHYIKKEMEENILDDNSQEHADTNSVDDTSCIGSSESSYFSKMYKLDKDPELIIPDIYVKSAISESETLSEVETKSVDIKDNIQTHQYIQPPSKQYVRENPSKPPVNDAIPSSFAFESENCELEKEDIMGSYKLSTNTNDNESTSSSLFPT